MRLEKDFEKLLGLLNKHKVRYCIVGAYAVAFYATPRYTGDMDILVEPKIENGRKVITALKEFGFSSLKLKENDFAKESVIIQLGYAPVRVDLLTSIDGCKFKEVWESKKSGKYGRKKVFFIGLRELVKNKKAVKRPQDIMDLKILKNL